MTGQAKDVFEREFPALRGKLIEVAAALDRLDRAEGTLDDDPRMRQIRQSLQLLSSPDAAARAEQVQMIFSLPYDPEWRGQLARS